MEKGSIQVEHVSKRFLLSGRRSADLREMLSQCFGPRSSATDLWALKDVSFTIEPGTALGIVGHNGSGKSTMLKLLTNILTPTSGVIRTHGRIGALIEVGAGFQPDLTGRENVFLNGSLLGLKRSEILRKFDAIVQFAGLEKFIDTPVKRYSSGMYMRLGFSIAAHTDPDILLVDEVLAVGDAHFQNKCMRRMKEFLAQGGTVVFVSHAMGLVAELCRQCVWLDHGRLLHHGETSEVFDRYTALVTEREEEEFKRNFPDEWAIREQERLRAEEEAEREAHRRLEEARTKEEQRQTDLSYSCITGISVLDAEGVARNEFPVGEPLRVRLSYRLARPLPNPVFCLEILRNDGLLMFATNTAQHGLSLGDIPLQGHINLEVSFMSLNEGDYHIRLHLYPDYTGEDFYVNVPYEDRIENAFAFHVSGGRFAYGCAYLPIRWEPEQETRALLGTVQDFL